MNTEGTDFVRGMIYGILFSLPIWALIVFAVVAR